MTPTVPHSGWQTPRAIPLGDAPLDQHPIHIAVTAVGVEDPDAEVLSGVSKGLTGTLQYAAQTAGLVAHVSVTPGRSAS